MNISEEQITDLVFIVGAISKEFNTEPACLMGGSSDKDIYISFDVGAEPDCINYYPYAKKIWVTGDYDAVTTTQRRILNGIACDYTLKIEDE